MHSKSSTISASTRVLNWIVGTVTLVFIVVLAALIAAGRLTPGFLLWTEVCMIAAPAMGLIAFIIAALFGRYST